MHHHIEGERAQMMETLPTSTKSRFFFAGQAGDRRAPHDDRVRGDRRHPRLGGAHHGGAGVRLRRPDHPQEAARGQGMDDVQYCSHTL